MRLLLSVLEQEKRIAGGCKSPPSWPGSSKEERWCYIPEVEISKFSPATNTNIAVDDLTGLGRIDNIFRVMPV